MEHRTNLPTKDKLKVLYTLFKITSERGQPLYKGQNAESQMCSIIRKFHCSNKHSNGNISTFVGVCPLFRLLPEVSLYYQSFYLTQHLTQCLPVSLNLNVILALGSGVILCPKQMRVIGSILPMQTSPLHSGEIVHFV